MIRLTFLDFLDIWQAVHY